MNVSDVIKAQIKSKEILDKTKNCDTCYYTEDKECDSCIDSFLGIVFTPSNWKEKEG